jgi:Na+-transporting methylmalonyl-CoA/oxaloacetate decarboxylase gamma subunit
MKRLVCIFLTALALLVAAVGAFAESAATAVPAGEASAAEATAAPMDSAVGAFSTEDLRATRWTATSFRRAS